MSMLRQTIRNVAIIMLMVILFMPAAVHAHALELLGTETSHAAGGGCHDADNNTNQDTTDNHLIDVHCCELDTPYVLTSSPYLTVPTLTATYARHFDGGQLDGHSRRIYKPPR